MPTFSIGTATTELFEVVITGSLIGDLTLSINGTGITYGLDGAPNGGTLTSIGIVTSSNNLTLDGFAETDIAVLAGLDYNVTSEADLEAFLAQFGDFVINLNGGQAFDLLFQFGLAGNVVGSSGNDNIFVGGDGGSVDAKGGRDYLYGGMGSETLDGGNGEDYIYGGPDSGSTSSVGAVGEDVLTGGGGNDVIYGGAGNDLIRGGTGNDDLEGGGGDDIIHGGDGNDDIVGDRYYGGYSSDGNQGNDTIFGGDGNDDINGGVGDDELRGGTGNDDLRGGQGMDEMHGGAGNDYMQGARDEDMMYGGAGDDRMYGGFVRGPDEVDDDVMEGNQGSDEMYGGDGDDEILGQKDNDLLFGGEGSDYLRGGKGSDILLGDNPFFFRKGIGFETALEVEPTATPDTDTLKGGAGADVFAFYDIDTSDFDEDRLESDEKNVVIIEDFTDGKDVLMMLSGSFATSAAQYKVFKNSAVQDGDDIVFETASSMVIIENADMEDFSSEDFAVSIGSFGGMFIS